jgi:hypothetical protein
MFSPKLFFLYLIGGTIAVTILLYNLTVDYPVEDVPSIIECVIPIILLYFLAYKSFNAKDGQHL